MALLHAATIVPTKGELVAAWLPGRPWAATITTGRTRAEEIVDHGDRTERREPGVRVRGSGTGHRHRGEPGGRRSRTPR